ncbi:hypothetical protein VSVS12_00341 [Vibrio scophthalmi]|uniref:glycosyltransferase family 52 n=1 Tax=Vibrio scophthalmi TaxID=45658 RepID=UPI00080980A9|nr:glycosyltransferase family 52 [Vibrio scophthalmi]ANS84158.1 hypothetical protein VSVS12_00341 [Vibrio scophthalmi]
MNLFLVTSPLQLLCAIEAKSEYQTKGNILILRLEKSSSSNLQMKVLLDENEWDHIILLGRRSKVWEARKLHSKLKKANPGLHFQYVFYADYSAWRTNVILSNISAKNEIMFDDGVGTIREFYEKIKPRNIITHNKISRDLLLTLVGLNPPRKVYPRDNFSFFTFFELPGSEHPIRTNYLNVLQGRLNTSTCYCKDASIGFIGQGMVAELGIKLDYYVDMLEKIIKDNNKPMVYFPHRTEREDVKQKILRIPGLTYHHSTLPLELEIADKKIKLSKIYGIASTASISLQKLYPKIEVIDLMVPIKHYEQHEFGKTFTDVAKLLSLDSIKLD